MLDVTSYDAQKNSPNLGVLWVAATMLPEHACRRYYRAHVPLHHHIGILLDQENN